MILVDTSVWVDHLRQAGDAGLVPLLNAGMVCCHPGGIGELACGNLRVRQKILTSLKGLPSLAVAADDEVLFFIKRHQLMDRNIRFVDVPLLASITLSGDGRFWMRDKRLLVGVQMLRLDHTEVQLDSESLVP